MRGCKNEEKEELKQEATVSPELAADWMWEWREGGMRSDGKVWSLSGWASILRQSPAGGGKGGSGVRAMI